MSINRADSIRSFLARRVVQAFLESVDTPEGEVKKKFVPSPNVKPPRRRPSGRNKSNRGDYMQKYMKKYRGEGKDYQKIPENIKKMRRQQRKRIKAL